MTESLAGRYDRIASLGRGAMGEVWLATDRVLGRQVAIKKILTGQLGDFDSHAADRVVREARVAARIHHPNVVAVFDLITEGGEPFMIMEYISGQTLAERIRQRGRLDPVELLSVLGGLVDALETAHRAGVTHRDIKPANIMIDDGGRAKLADFGIARGLGDGSLTETGSMLGTVAYMAPEVARGESATPASDVYSLGATIFAAVEGLPPHVEPGQPDNSAAILARLVTRPAPQAEHAGLLTGLLSQMLSSSASARPTAGEVRRRVSELIASRLNSAAGPPPAAEAVGPAGKHSEVDAPSMLLPVEPTVIRAQPSQESSGPTGSEQPAVEEPEQSAAIADENPPDGAPELSSDQTRYRDQAVVQSQPAPAQESEGRSARRVTTLPRGRKTARWAAAAAVVAIVGGGAAAAYPSRHNHAIQRPVGIAALPGTVYVLHADSALSAIAPDGRSVRTIAGVPPGYGIIAPPNSPNAGTLYVLNSTLDKTGDTIFEVRPDGRPVIQISVGELASTMAIAPAGSPNAGTLYIAHLGDVASGRPGTTVSVVKPGETVAKNIEVGSWPEEVVVAPAGTVNAGNVYVSHRFSQGPGFVSVIDAKTSKVQKVTVGVNPRGLTVTPARVANAGDVFTLNAGRADGSTASVISPGSTIARTLQVGSVPWGIAIAPEGTPNAGTVYIASSNAFSQIAPGEVTAKKIGPGVDDGFMAIAPAGVPNAGSVFVGGVLDQSILVYRPGVPTPESIRVGRGILGIEVVPARTPNPGTVYVSSYGSLDSQNKFSVSHTVSVIAPGSKVSETVDVGFEPAQIEVVPAGTPGAGTAYVVPNIDQDVHTVAAFDPGDTTPRSISVGSKPIQLIVLPKGS